MKNFKKWMECKSIEVDKSTEYYMLSAYIAGACEVFEALSDLGFIHDNDEAWDAIDPILES